MHARIRLMLPTVRHFALGVWAVLSLAPIAACQSTPQSAPADTRSYSAIATYTDTGKVAVAPDGKFKVRIRRQSGFGEFNPASVIVQTQHGKLVEKIQFGLDTEVLWSPDSMAFTVTGSTEGANGRYETAVFHVGDSRLEKIELTPLITREFGHPVKCGWPELPNVIALKWLAPSQRLLIAAQIINHSNCDSFGTFKAYAVDITVPRVVEVYDQIKTKQLFGTELGRELLEVNDNCIRKPPSCYVSANHPELNSKP
jgi:hypothetical protein